MADEIPSTAWGDEIEKGIPHPPLRGPPSPRGRLIKRVPLAVKLCFLKVDVFKTNFHLTFKPQGGSKVKNKLAFPLGKGDHGVVDEVLLIYLIFPLV